MRSDDETEQLIRDHIQRYGWHVVNVGRRQGEPGPEWSFSIGLFQRFQHPEVVVFGLPRERRHAVLDVIGERIRGGSLFRADAECADLLEGSPCAFKPVWEGWIPAILGIARGYYRSGAFPALQCFWPDRARRFPWDARFDPALADAQPLLYHDDADRARVRALIESMQAQRGRDA